MFLKLRRELKLTEWFDPPTALLVSDMAERPFTRSCTAQWLNLRDFQQNFSIVVKYPLNAAD
jgi:hypothetical protein